MNLLNKLATGLLGLGGKTPSKFSNKPIKKHELGGPDLTTSQLDLNGKTPPKYPGASKYERDLEVSRLDLDGKTPGKYLDNPPQ